MMESIRMPRRSTIGSDGIIKGIFGEAVGRFFKPIGGAVAGVAGTAAAAHFDPNSDFHISIYTMILCIIVISIIILLLMIVWKLLSLKIVQRLLGKEYQYEGVWLEKYEARAYGTRDFGDTVRDGAVLKSISVIQKDISTGVITIHGRAFRDIDTFYSSSHNGTIFLEDDDLRRIDYLYEVDYSNRPGRGRGWGYCVFEPNAGGGHPVFGLGHFLEIESEERVWIPMTRFPATKLERSDVQKLIEKPYPITEEDYRKLALKIK